MTFMVKDFLSGNFYFRVSVARSRILQRLLARCHLLVPFLVSSILGELLANSPVVAQ